MIGSCVVSAVINATTMRSNMMTSSNGNIFRVTGPLCGDFTDPGEFPTQRPVSRSSDVFFDLHPNKKLSKQPWGWWFETQSWSLWLHCNKPPNMHLFSWGSFGNPSPTSHRRVGVWWATFAHKHWWPVGDWLPAGLRMIKKTDRRYATLTKNVWELVMKTKTYF